MKNKLDDLFLPQVDVTVDSELPKEDMIDLSDIEIEADALAKKLVNKVKKMYFNDNTIIPEGYAATVIERAQASIALLEKMIISNSQIQDRLIKNICLNSSNTGLYMSLARVQDAIMDIQSNITKELQKLHKDLTEIKNLDIEEEENEEIVSTAFRGGRDFLRSLTQENKDDNKQ